MNLKRFLLLLCLTFVIIIPNKVNALEIKIEDVGNYKYNNFIKFEEDTATPDEFYEYQEEDWDLCTKPEALKVFKFIGNLLKVIFIAVPILLIVMGSIDFLKATTAGKEDDMKKAQTTFVKRIIAAVVVFLIPLIVGIIVDLLVSSTKNNEIESNCITCLLNPSSCNIEE